MHYRIDADLLQGIRRQLVEMATEPEIESIGAVKEIIFKINGSIYIQRKGATV